MGRSLPQAAVGQRCATGRPRARDDRFTRSMQEPRPRSRHLHAGHHLAKGQAPARPIPEPESVPGFDATYNVSTRHQWFARARLRDPHLPRSMARLFPRRSPPQLLTAAAHGGLRPPPPRRPRRATRPTSPAPHLLHSTASSDLVFYNQPPSTFVFTPPGAKGSRRADRAHDRWLRYGLHLLSRRLGAAAKERQRMRYQRSVFLAG